MAAKPYDPLDSDTWPEEQIEAAVWVGIGIGKGDLQPLADYLKKYEVVPELIREWLAKAIERDPEIPFHLITKAKKRGQRGWAEEAKNHDRKMRVGLAAEQEVRASGKGGFEGAIVKITDRTGLGRTTVLKHREYALAVIAEQSESAGRDVFEESVDSFGPPESDNR